MIGTSGANNSQDNCNEPRRRSDDAMVNIPSVLENPSQFRCCCYIDVGEREVTYISSSEEFTSSDISVCRSSSRISADVSVGSIALICRVSKGRQCQQYVFRILLKMEDILEKLVFPLFSEDDRGH
jgi:hypothetical protein